MCDFPTPMSEGARGPPPGETTCPSCFEKSLEERRDAEGTCGLDDCGGKRPVAPCGSATCAFKDPGVWPPCSDAVCPRAPPPLIDCKRPDGSRCNPYGNPTCLTDSSFKFGHLKNRYRTTDFSKYTFDKNKFIPKTYLPGDGADFLCGYNEKINADDTYGRCESEYCETKLDYLLQKLKKPLYPTQSFQSNVSCSSQKPCPFKSATCGIIPKSNKNETCRVPACLFDDIKPKPTGCGAPDCKYGPPKTQKGCGAPDCKFSQKSLSYNSVHIGTDSTKGKGDSASCNKEVCPVYKSDSSNPSCDNPECPFAKKAVQECHDKTCPYAKELVICQDCGGVIVEGVEVEPVEQPPPIETALFESPAVTTSVEVEKARILPEKQKRAEATKHMREEKKKNNEQNQTKTESTKPSKKKKEIIFQYPGTILGHHDCMKKRKNIPANMGWLWNIKPTVGNPDLWRGYKPGAICKKVHKIIKKHRRALGILDPSEIMKKKRSRTSTRALSDKNKRVISVRKKEGNYVVTLTPIKDPALRTGHESPFVDCTPVQFKINKQPKTKKDKDGTCQCDDEDEEKDSDSDLSELDVNFSPPAAIPMRPYLKKKIKVTKDTQYCADDFPKQSKPVLSGKSDKSSKKKGKKKVGF